MFIFNLFMLLQNLGSAFWFPIEKDFETIAKHAKLLEPLQLRNVGLPQWAWWWGNSGGFSRGSLLYLSCISVFQDSSCKENSFQGVALLLNSAINIQLQMYNSKFASSLKLLRKKHCLLDPSRKCSVQCMNRLWISDRSMKIYSSTHDYIDSLYRSPRLRTKIGLAKDSSKKPWLSCRFSCHTLSHYLGISFWCMGLGVLISLLWILASSYSATVEAEWLLVDH